MHGLLNPRGDYVEVSEAQALARYAGFGARLFEMLYARNPHLRGHFRFFRDLQSDDLWSVCDWNGKSFGLQLDPDIEVICLWDEMGSEELGSWLDDPVGAALERIDQDYLQKP